MRKVMMWGAGTVATLLGLSWIAVGGGEPLAVMMEASRNTVLKVLPVSWQLAIGRELIVSAKEESGELSADLRKLRRWLTEHEAELEQHRSRTEDIRSARHGLMERLRGMSVGGCLKIGQRNFTRKELEVEADVLNRQLQEREHAEAALIEQLEVVRSQETSLEELLELRRREIAKLETSQLQLEHDNQRRQRLGDGLSKESDDLERAEWFQGHVRTRVDTLDAIAQEKASTPLTETPAAEALLAKE